MKYTLLLFLFSCSTTKNFFVPDGCSAAYYVDDAYQNYSSTEYKFRPDLVTPLGAHVDTSGFAVDVAKIDADIVALGACLHMTIHACAVRILIAPDMERTDDNRQWFQCHPGGVPDRCAGTNQWPAIVVTTPDLASLPHELEHDVTHKRHLPPPNDDTSQWCAP